MGILMKSEKRHKKLKGITKRWIMHVLLVVLLIVVIAEVVAFVAIHNFFYEKVRQELYYQAGAATTAFARNSAIDKSEFLHTAKQYVEGFTEKEKMEIEILDAQGSPYACSSGLKYEMLVMNDDIKFALDAGNDYGEWTGKNENGERIMAVSAISKSGDGNVLGVIRFVVSLEYINKQIVMLDFMAIGIGIIIFVFVYFVGYYFISSIVRPVVQVGETARKIALGDFSVRIEKTGDDEIGDLCDTINYMAEELGTTEKLKNDFISSVSHELRTPLTAIKGWAETVKNAGENKEIASKGMNIIIRESTRLSSLLEDMLDFSHLSTGKFTINFTRTDVLAELSEAVYVYERQAKENGVDIKYEQPGKIIPVIGDANRLRQVFVNIIDNAVKYSKEGGTVNISTEVTDDELTIIVADNGVGIPADELDRVKEKFYKVNQTVKGSGIGLAVADEIITRHNGTLEIESVENRGTTVKITLPIDKSDVDKADIETME